MDTLEILVVLSFLFFPRVDCGEKPETDIVQNPDREICFALEDAALVCLFHCINMWRYSFCGMWNVLREICCKNKSL